MKGKERRRRRRNYFKFSLRMWKNCGFERGTLRRSIQWGFTACMPTKHPFRQWKAQTRGAKGGSDNNSIQKPTLVKDGLSYVFSVKQQCGKVCNLALNWLENLAISTRMESITFYFHGPCVKHGMRPPPPTKLANLKIPLLKLEMCACA